jgi:hypothetical protein
MKSWNLFALLLSISLAARAQKIDYPDHFKQLLAQCNVEFFEPVEAGYKDFEPWTNPYQPCHFAIRSREEDLQIRYFLQPWNENDPFATTPHVATFRLLTNLATNADEAVISAIQPTKKSLKEDFNADWGMIYFFQPKAGFSDLPNCRLLALYKEGKGTVFVFYLFKDPGNEALDTRYLALRFM